MNDFYEIPSPLRCFSAPALASSCAATFPVCAWCDFLLCAVPQSALSSSSSPGKPLAVLWVPLPHACLQPGAAPRCGTVGSLSLPRRQGQILLPGDVSAELQSSLDPLVKPSRALFAAAAVAAGSPRSVPSLVGPPLCSRGQERASPCTGHVSGLCVQQIHTFFCTENGDWLLITLLLT